MNAFIQLGPVHATPEEFKNETITGHFGFVFEKKTRERKSHDYHVASFPKNLRFRNVCPPRENAKPAFSNSSGLKSVFEKLRFRDGLVWTVGLAVEIKLRF